MLLGDLICKSKLLMWSYRKEFSSINFDKLLKIVLYLTAESIINEDALPIMYYHTGIYFPELKFEAFINIH